MALSITLILCVLALIVHSTAGVIETRGGDSPTAWGDWTTWGDLGNSQYRNPVLPADYSDLDFIRVGTDYYAISSTFQYSPGMVILRSKDAVNWRIEGHAISNITEMGTSYSWESMDRYGLGVWAGAIRYHDGMFWVYYGTPQEGYFMTKAEAAAGPWSPLVHIWQEPG